MKIRKGDKVIVISGKDRGKTGVVTHAFPQKNQVLLEGVNLRRKHEKPRGSRKGQIVERATPIHASNVMIVDPKTNTGTRISIRRKDGERVRVAKKSGAELS
ncbi:MAG: 50S ribosomal protein L24 [bacterium]|nr:50S ribosomal protein L24 [bacterium]